MNKIVVITGGTSGIGFSIADTFLNSDCSNVVITSRSADRLNDAIEALKKKHPDKEKGILGVILDLNGAVENFRTVFKRITNELAGKPINIWVNNAGIYQGTKFGNVTEDEWNNLMDTNLKAQYFLSQIVSNYMIEMGIEGNILNLCSSSTFRPSIDPYMISKLGMSGLTLGMAKKLIQHG